MSSTKTGSIRVRDPEPEELKNVRMGIYNALYPALQNFSATDFTKQQQQAQNLTNTAMQTQGQLMGQLGGLINSNQGLLSQLTNTINTGKIPSQLTDAMNQSVNRNMQSSMGSMLNNLSNRGVLNSSITSKGINNLADNTANAYNQNYLNAFNSVINGYGTALQGGNSNLSNTLSGIQAMGNIPTQAYESAFAGLTPYYNFWKDWESLQNSKPNDSEAYVMKKGLF